ncbi:pancreatic lipase-related protein 2-like [Strongylocentrotus purpuratus]|uniref:Lipase domain-containing protein n=1 Tax=Strongylocentrotus purpuratus TaxID=7668 RepID=A0A7M7NPJ5_STRPU|nr:pancreatic lipase-related protein 2-like [Strongylocentrotus purpuratus]
MGGLGLTDELGHQDFYPNGGMDMPNCYFSIICDHMKAIAYYTESISKRTPCRFRPTTWAPKWDNYKKGIQTRDCRNMACPDMGYTASSFQPLVTEHSQLLPQNYGIIYPDFFATSSL